MSYVFKIVCVDDNQDILNIYRDVFEGTQYQVVEFELAEEALKFIQNHSNEILFVFSDYSMPSMDGLEFRKRMLDISPEIPFALITAFFDKQMAKKGMELRIASFLEKPFSDTAVIALIDDFGEKRKNQILEEKEMIISFINESSPMLDEIESLILLLESSPESSTVLNTYFRLLHTIKGTASCVGLKSIPHFAHKYEDLVGKLKSGELNLNPTVFDTLLRGLDHLRFMYDEVKTGVCFEFEIEEWLTIFEQDFTQQKSTSNSQSGVQKIPKVEDNVSPAKMENQEDRIPVELSILNSFMELSGQMTVLRNTIMKCSTQLAHRYVGDHDVDMMSESLDEMHKVSSTLQSEISEMRKVSLETVFRPFKRVVRDASKLTGKKIDFIIEGEELKVDTVIGKVLSNSLVHMIRNSVDHGIETADKRIANGKNDQGRILLKTFEDGENIVVELSDDGAGLNIERIKAKAIENGLYSAEQLANMPTHKIFSIIFESGFSTASQVTDLSGRGVGMDMVRSSVEGVGGKILIDSELGRGSKFLLVLPIPRSVLIIKSLMVKTNNGMFAVPLEEVAEVVRFGEERGGDLMHQVNDTILLRHHNEIIPLLCLESALVGEKCPSRDEVLSNLDIVIVKGEGYKYGLIVQEILDIEEIVVKKLSKQMKSAFAVLGATFVGNGEVGLILNLKSMAEHFAMIGQDDTVFNKYAAKTIQQIKYNEFMQFNLGKYVNYAVNLDCVMRLEEVSLTQVEYSGDMPLIQYRDGVLPLISLVDVLGLPEQIQFADVLNVIVIKTEDKVLGLVVSEILDIAQTSEEINDGVKDRESILGTVFINEKTVSVIDPHYIFANYKKFKTKISKELIEENSEAA